jgi:hypothetical protein
MKEAASVVLSDLQCCAAQPQSQPSHRVQLSTAAHLDCVLAFRRINTALRRPCSERSHPFPWPRVPPSHTSSKHVGARYKLEKQACALVCRHTMNANTVAVSALFGSIARKVSLVHSPFLVGGAMCRIVGRFGGKPEANRLISHSHPLGSAYSIASHLTLAVQDKVHKTILAQFQEQLPLSSNSNVP